MENWKLLTIVADGEILKIEGANVWDHSWKKLNMEPFEVPHPSYPNQRHKLRPYYIEHNGKQIHFAAGELSNCVWCFYVPINHT